MLHFELGSVPKLGIVSKQLILATNIRHSDYPDSFLFNKLKFFQQIPFDKDFLHVQAVQFLPCHSPITKTWFSARESLVLSNNYLKFKTEMVSNLTYDPFPNLLDRPLR